MLGPPTPDTLNWAPFIRVPRSLLYGGPERSPNLDDADPSKTTSTQTQSTLSPISKTQLPRPGKCCWQAPRSELLHPTGSPCHGFIGLCKRFYRVFRRFVIEFQQAFKRYVGLVVVLKVLHVSYAGPLQSTALNLQRSCIGASGFYEGYRGTCVNTSFVLT